MDREKMRDILQTYHDHIVCNEHLRGEEYKAVIVPKENEAIDKIMELLPKPETMVEQEIFDTLVRNYPKVTWDKWPDIETFTVLTKALLGKIPVNKDDDDLTAAYMAGFEKGKDKQAEELATLKEELSKANICPFCGSTDLVCGKAWKEERDKLKREIAKMKEALKKCIEVLTNPDIGTIDYMEGSQIYKDFRDVANIAKEALK